MSTGWNNAESVFVQIDQAVGHVEILQLEPGWTARDAKRSYRRLSLLLHPDKHPEANVEQEKILAAYFSKVSTSYEKLTTPHESEEEGEGEGEGEESDARSASPPVSGAWSSLFHDLSQVTRAVIDIISEHKARKREKRNLRSK
jgi:curved DNA-binding protein CbpA